MTLLRSNKITLRPIIRSDINEKYVSWLNDPIVNCFLETRFSVQTLDTVLDYWSEHNGDSSSPWWAICRDDEHHRHIGNIKLGPIHPIHSKADISLFIGDRNSWGFGFATQAIALVRDHAFNDLLIHKISAGIYSNNIASIRAFEKCNFTHEATLKDEVILSGSLRVDVLRYGLINPRFM